MELRQEINDKLHAYTEKNCLNCYAQVRKDGRVHLDDRFKIEHLKDIMVILEGLEEG